MSAFSKDKGNAMQASSDCKDKHFFKRQAQYQDECHHIAKTSTLN
jgi:hypothetical protein